MNETNGTSTTQSEQAIALRRSMMAINSVLQSRANLAGQLGTQFGGDRDVYASAGYPKTLDYEHYNNKYERQEIAGRIVRLPAQWTWREPPMLKDGDKGDTAFTDAWKTLTSIGVKDIADQKTIWHYLERADRVSGIGRFGMLLIGLSDKSGSSLANPIPSGTLDDKDFLYLQPLDEGAVTIESLDKDQRSRRFNLPEFYKVYVESSVHADEITGRSAKTGKQERVHWSRVVHIADTLKTDEIYGKPRLKGVYNLLNVLEKVTAGSGEAAWLLMNKGYITSTKDGYTLAAGTETGDASSEVTTTEIQNFVHGLTRFLELEGVDVNVLGGEVVDPSGLINTIIALISGETGIPQRLLLGNEQGQLASSQDERNWGSYIQGRQKNFAEPIVLRPLISRLIFTGILPEPESGNYTVEWPDTFSLNELEKAEQNEKNGNAIADAVGRGGMPLETYLREFLNWSDDQVEAMYTAKEREMNLGFEDRITGIDQ